jgi:hypothetical protein
MLNARRQVWAIGLALAPAVAAAGQLATGVVVDPQRGAAYVMSASGLESVDVMTGRTVWSTAQATRPIATYAGRLLAQSAGADPGRLRLVILDAERGRLLREVVLELPSGAESRIDDRPGSLFRIEAEQAGPHVDLRWSSERRRLQGVMPEADDAEAVRRFGGRVVVDLAAAVIEARQGGAPDPGLVPLPAGLAREAETGVFRERPQRMGALFVATQEVPQEGARALVLRRWDAQGVALSPFVLPAGVTLQLASDDGAFVLLSRRIAGAPPPESHLWTVLSLDSGYRVAELRAGTAAARFAVARGRVLYAEPAGGQRDGGGWTARPLSLRAADASGAGTGWSRPLRDTAFRGRWVP